MIANAVALGFGTAFEVAKAVAFLASGDSSYMTGEWAGAGGWRTDVRKELRTACADCERRAVYALVSI
jgi:NAD(P)-dependent dehydrogenase (short-subunit alcohol dehydrogenase family)